MVKKKAFIDKKNSSTYHLVRRSQRDVGGYYDEETGEVLDVPKDFVLMPTQETQQKIDDLKFEDQQQAKLARQELKLQQIQEQHEQLAREEESNQKQQQQQQQEESIQKQDAFTRARAQLKQFDLVDDYDYDQHVMPITGNGVFVSKDGNRSDPSKTIDPRLLKKNTVMPMEPIIQEMDRKEQLDSIAITADCMEEDMAQALFDFQDGDFEEILDDFCFTAAQEPEFEDVKDEFDFDAHVARLIQKARMEENGGARVALDSHDAWVKSTSAFKGIKPFQRIENDAEDAIDYEYDGENYGEEGEDLDEFDYDQGEKEVNPGVVAKLKPQEEAALVEKFEQTLLEYDSDDMGDLDEEYLAIGGDKPLEGDVHFEDLLDQFLQEKKDENFLAGTRHTEIRHGGSSKVFVKGNLMPFNAIDKQAIEEEEEEENIDEVLAEADLFLANPEVDLPPEEVFIDGKSYFTMKERNPWDCESILSTYSNLDNNPAVIVRSGSGRRRKKNKKKLGGLGLDDDETTIPEEKPVQILLSNKTGLPLGVLSERGGGKHDDDEDLEQETFMSVNKGEARKKNETQEEKKARKQAVKEDRQIARIQKKMMREAIMEEIGNRSGNGDAHDVAGKTVFRYS